MSRPLGSIERLSSPTLQPIGSGSGGTPQAGSILGSLPALELPRQQSADPESKNEQQQQQAKKAKKKKSRMSGDLSVVEQGTADQSPQRGEPTTNLLIVSQTPPDTAVPRMAADRDQPSRSRRGASPADGAAPPPIYAASHQQDIDKSIHILENSKWRVLLEYGPAGEVVSLAAFCPGNDSAPHTPCTPSAAVEGMMERGMGQILDRVAVSSNSAGYGYPPASADSTGRRQPGYSLQSGGSFSTPDGWQRHEGASGEQLQMTDLWVNTANHHGDGGGGVYRGSAYNQARRSPRLLGPVQPPGNGHGNGQSSPPEPLGGAPPFGTAPSAGLRFHAWTSGNHTPIMTTPRSATTMPLRRGAPAGLWRLLHVFGLRELEIHVHLRQPNRT